MKRMRQKGIKERDITMSRINLDEAILVVVDYQEKLLPAMNNKDEIAEKTAKLIQGCRILGVPILATQQYTKGLGETVDIIKNALTEPIGDDIPASEFKHVEKKSFSCMDEPDFRDALVKSGRDQVIVCGIEAHVCVQQTAIDLFDYGIDDDYVDYDDDGDEYSFDGEEEKDNVVILIDRPDDGIEEDEDYTGLDFEVFLACDCVGSRDENDKNVAINRMSDIGIEMMTMESILFEMTRSAESPHFKQISKTVK